MCRCTGGVKQAVYRAYCRGHMLCSAYRCSDFLEYTEGLMGSSAALAGFCFFVLISDSQPASQQARKQASKHPQTSSAPKPWPLNPQRSNPQNPKPLRPPSLKTLDPKFRKLYESLESARTPILKSPKHSESPRYTNLVF